MPRHVCHFIMHFPAPCYRSRPLYEVTVLAQPKDCGSYLREDILPQDRPVVVLVLALVPLGPEDLV